MRQFSRHLPSLKLAKSSLGWKEWLVVGIVAPLMLPMLLLAILVSLPSLISERRRIKALKASREDTICAFRRAFNCRLVDPWIIRATYEEARQFVPDYPLEAADRIKEDLKIEEEDLDDLILSIAERSGYALTHTSSNPWYDRVKSIGDIVLFINHQPKTRLA